MAKDSKAKKMENKKDQKNAKVNIEDSVIQQKKKDPKKKKAKAK